MGNPLQEMIKDLMNDAGLGTSNKEMKHSVGETFYWIKVDPASDTFTVASDSIHSVVEDAQGIRYVSTGGFEFDEKNQHKMYFSKNALAIRMMQLLLS